MSSLNTAPIANPSIYIEPSKKLTEYIRNIKVVEDLPIGLSTIIFKNKPKPSSRSSPKVHHLITEEDEKYIKSLSTAPIRNTIADLPLTKTCSSNNKLLSLEDLHWLYNYLKMQNKEKDDKVYLHELLEGSNIILPQNKEIPRNEELEKRCNQLKAEQENLKYFKMTKNVDSKRNIHPEDTIGYQLKQMNRHMIAIFQFVMSVAAGFVFGFFGLELLVGNLDFGFRLLMGIICSLTIALAELYFLAKKLNEDLQFESISEKENKKGIKLD
ncbi:transmembrane protein 199-like isoform X1 [Diorhabda carinulata]|uniref:transmembrane protein 199-like isoform X1 n=1 Tax=Diorhabda carinulata TaxID=1163345 RepID=UPI0025A2D755|nr:transmembrane protein 199-like isoform X1 [Diorhabda carinulata]